MASGYSGTPLAKKLSLRDGQRCWFHAMPEHVQDEIDEYALELIFVADPAEGVDAAHVFTTRRAELAAWNARHPHRKRGLAMTPVKFGISFTLTFLNQAGAHCTPHPAAPLQRQVRRLA